MYKHFGYGSPMELFCSLNTKYTQNSTIYINKTNKCHPSFMARSIQVPTTWVYKLSTCTPQSLLLLTNGTLQIN